MARVALLENCAANFNFYIQKVNPDLTKLVVFKEEKFVLLSGQIPVITISVIRFGSFVVPLFLILTAFVMHAEK